MRESIRGLDLPQSGVVAWMRAFPTADFQPGIDTAEAARLKEQHVLVKAQTASIYGTRSDQSSKGGRLRE